jgi:hypothetical protein|tara:strand:+ start:401 stop:751 length:351 start_codon:yes stop_codon:yes gene_type:complete
LTLLGKSGIVYTGNKGIKMFHQDEIDFIEAKKNLNKQSLALLHDIVNAYQKGLFDDPRKADFYCNMLACICEGKVEGSIQPDSMEVAWSITKEYKDYMEANKKPAEDEENIVAGPW